MKNANILKGIQADEEILKFFRPNEKPFIYKLLKFLRMSGDVITWDDDTLEVNINGRDYPGSRIVDILSYCKAQPCRASLCYPFHNTAAHTEATPTREGI